MPKGFIMMTALPPTRGHMQVIEFACAFAKTYGLSYIDVMVCAQPEEPYDGLMRMTDLANSFDTEFYYENRVRFHHINQPMPQQPGDDIDFWGLWQSVIYATVGQFADDDIVFSSEMYGYPLAKVLGCKHVPYDLGREVTFARASNVRKEPIKHWYSLAPAVAKRFYKTVTLFGAESTGKTTMAKNLAQVYNSRALHEWARPYLESLPSPEVTDERMETIIHGQRSLEQSAKKLPQTPFIFRDTDLLSTVGYYRIYADNTPVVAIDRADLYLLMSSDVPFVADPLRYGGDVRESTDKFWEDLLVEYMCRHEYIDQTFWGFRQEQALSACNALIKDIPWVGYERKGNKNG